MIPKAKEKEKARTGRAENVNKVDKVNKVNKVNKVDEPSDTMSAGTASNAERYSTDRHGGTATRRMGRKRQGFIDIFAE